MVTDLLILAGATFVGGAIWIAELIHRCGVYRRHIAILETRLEEAWYRKTFPDGV